MTFTTLPARDLHEGQMIVVTLADGGDETAIIRETWVDGGRRYMTLTTFGQVSRDLDAPIQVVTGL